MRLLLLCVLFLSSCSDHDLNIPQNSNNSDSEEENELLSLERKWLEAEFALDTGYISALIDSTFISISANGVSNKQDELKGMYNNISAMRRDSVFLDSLKLEDPLVNVYGNTAVVTFIVHTYKREKGKLTEKKTRFYDVWVKRNGAWKAVSAQGTPLTE